MAENRSEITFAEVKDSMQLNENEVEEFLIDVIKTRLVRAKISQVRRGYNFFFSGGGVVGGHIFLNPHFLPPPHISILSFLFHFFRLSSEP